MYQCQFNSRYLQASFFQTFGEALWCCWTALTVQDNSARQRGNGKVLESASFEIPILISELVYEQCNI